MRDEEHAGKYAGKVVLLKQYRPLLLIEKARVLDEYVYHVAVWYGSWTVFSKTITVSVADVETAADNGRMFNSPELFCIDSELKRLADLLAEGSLGDTEEEGTIARVRARIKELEDAHYA